MHSNLFHFTFAGGNRKKVPRFINHAKYYNMAQESNNVNFKIQNIVIQGKDLLLSVIMNERDFVLTIDKESFDNWFTDGTNIISWVTNPPEQEKEGVTSIEDWWSEIIHNDTVHKGSVKQFIEQDVYPLGMMKAQYLYDSILYDDMKPDLLQKALWAFQEQIRLCTMLWSNRQFTKENGFKYTKEIKIC